MKAGGGPGRDPLRRGRGPPGALALLVGEPLGVKLVLIDYRAGDGRWQVQAPGIMEVTALPEARLGRVGRQELVAKPPGREEAATLVEGPST